MGLKATGSTRITRITRKRPQPGGKGGGMVSGGGRPAGRLAPGRPPRAARAAAPREPFDRPAGAADWRVAVRATVEGLRYELVDVERAPGGLLRVTIERLPDQAYAAPGEAVTVDDCEAVTRQLQYALAVDGVDYTRLEVSSPGLDRPLRRVADFERFCGQAVSLTLKAPFQGRKNYQGLLGRTEAAWQLTFSDGRAEQQLTFALDEVREARLVPVLDFKRRQGQGVARRGPENEAASPQAEDKRDKSR